MSVNNSIIIAAAAGVVDGGGGQPNTVRLGELYSYPSVQHWDPTGRWEP